MRFGIKVGMSKKFLFLIFLCFSYLYPYQVPGMDFNGTLQFQAERVSTLNDKIELQGEVFIKHPLGQLQAKEAVLYTQGKSTNRWFTSCLLKHGVKITLESGENLQAEEARLDFSDLNCVCSGGERHERVVFTGMPSNQQIQQRMSCDQLTCYFEKDGKSWSPKKLIGEGEVLLQTANGMRLYADRIVLFERLLKFHEVSKAQKLGKAQALSPGGLKFEHPTLGTLYGENALFDFLEDSIVVDYPQGEVYISSNQPIDFSADRLLWHQKKNSVLFQGNMQFFSAKIGQCIGQGWMRLDYDHLTGLQFLLGAGAFKIEDENRSFSFKGRLHFKQTGWLQIDKSGEDQILIQEGLKDFLTDKMILYFDFPMKKETIKEIHMLGNVKAATKVVLNIGESPYVSQFLIASKAIYRPKKGELELSSEKPKKVLFFDRMNQIQVNSQGVIFKLNAKGIPEFVKGKGTVRFSFVEKELDEIKKKFQQFM
jgi:hypothetical protein